MNRRTQLVLLATGLSAFGLLLVFAQRMPGLFANATILGGILALEIALVGLCHFESLFFPLLMGSFLWAGTALPFGETANSLRWLFLGVAAFGGFAIWIKNSRLHRFAVFHLVALACVASACVSAAVSEIPRTALLKVSSLFLLFLYASAGARLAIAGREKQFIAGLVLACEWLAYISATCYFVLKFRLFGNPNALGAAIGVVAVPVLFWAAFTADTRALRHRRLLASILCAGLLYVSDSRASILGATVAVLMFTIAARYQRLLFQFALAFLFLFTFMAVVNSSHTDDLVSSVAGRILYKDPTANHEILESRMSPWEQTFSSIRRHPWFGSGFGTSELGSLRPNSTPSSVSTVPGWNREHGSSYLALAEYLGLLGTAPFAILLLMVLHRLVRAFRWVRATGDPSHMCVPFALVVLAGLVHAGFEDWLFAVGSYLCVFFWVCAFLLTDLVPPGGPAKALSARRLPRFPLAAQVSHSVR
jgi:O-antigen ligase